MQLIILGAPGAGKGTQAARIVDQLAVPAISTGDIFRANIKNETDLGRQVKSILASGGFVPDEVTNAIVADRIAQPDCANGFLLDGYPRTLAQVDELDDMVGSGGRRLDAVVVLTADPEELVTRLLQRAVEQGRKDDTEAVIRRRQELYREQTEPLIDVYRERGLLVEVDGMGGVDEVTQRIFDALTPITQS